MLMLGNSSKVGRIFALFICLFGTFTHTISAQTRADSKKPIDASSKRESAPVATPPPVEQWDRLQVNANDLVASPVLPGEEAKFPEFTREFLRLEWRAGDPIELYVIRPIGVKNPPVVLYLYGYPSDGDRFRNYELCKNLTKNGFAAVGFVSALTGERYHGRPLKEWFVSELQESIGTSVHDVQMILNYLATRGRSGHESSRDVRPGFRRCDRHSLRGRGSPDQGGRPARPLGRLARLDRQVASDSREGKSRLHEAGVSLESRTPRSLILAAEARGQTRSPTGDRLQPRHSGSRADEDRGRFAGERQLDRIQDEGRLHPEGEHECQNARLDSGSVGAFVSSLRRDANIFGESRR